MTLPAAQQILFARDTGFTLGDILKIVQENGSDPLYVEMDSFDKWVRKVGDFDWGQDRRWNLNTDPGGGSIGRLAGQGGRFAPGDRTNNILGTMSPKLQTITYQFERYLKKLSGTQAAAYIENAEQEYNAKNMLQKNEMASQQLGDGTGRKAIPVSFGEAAVESGATFTVASPTTPLAINLSTDDGAAGSVAHCYEGLVISIVYKDNAGVARLLALSADDAGPGAATVYDAFRVVEVDQDNNRILVFPARTGTTATAIGSYVQGNVWIGATATGVVTFTPIKGIRPEYPAADANFGDPAGAGAGTAVQDALSTCALIHPLYVAEEQTGALAQFDESTWTSATDLSFLHDGVLTGLEALITNRENTVHGINRAAVRQYLATVKNNGGRNLTFNALFSFLSQHYNRNRNKGMSDFTGVLMNPLVYSSMVSLSEVDRKITEGTGVRGEEGAKLIKFGDKTYQLETHTSVRHDRTYLLPSGEIEQLGCEMEPVEVGGQSSFLSLVDGRRVNVEEAYSTVTGEMRVKYPRGFGVIRNFTFNRY